MLHAINYCGVAFTCASCTDVLHFDGFIFPCPHQSMCLHPFFPNAKKLTIRILLFLCICRRISIPLPVPKLKYEYEYGQDSYSFIRFGALSKMVLPIIAL
jgi:hypothetical protein